MRFINLSQDIYAFKGFYDKANIGFIFTEYINNTDNTW